jgi:protein involved in polysaccharide export with SLBB domain
MKNNRKLFTIVILWICFVYPVFAQTTALQPANAAADRSVQLARSNADYRVTPGDVYTLTYAAGSSSVTFVISVDSTYRIRVSNMGTVNGAGKTFIQVKNEVETIVTNNYPLSGVQLVLTEPAIFKVYVKGEVLVAGEVNAWALNRLSSLIDTSRPSSTSLRDVSIKSTGGQARVYDLFKAQRQGDLTQNPYLRPGDEITFNRVSRAVAINGQVGRPGTYQMLDGENISELIEFYGGGFTPVADKTRIELVRVVKSTGVAGEKIFLTESDITGNYVLENLDVITVPAILQLQPVIFVEGAVNTTTAIINPSNISPSNRITVQFNKGETYASMVRRNIAWFSTVSDTSNAYILRNEERIPMNLNPMLYDATYRGEVLLQENDVLVIPFRQYFVTVAGAVRIPGRYPYIPERNWEYYIALAGGFVVGLNTRESIVITDINGKTKKKTDAILPETVITAKTNHALYYWNQYAPVVTTVLSLAMTFFTIRTYMNR